MRKIIIITIILVGIFYFSNAYLVPQLIDTFNSADNLSIYIVPDLHFMSSELFNNDYEIFNNYVNNGDKLQQYTEVFMDVIFEEIKENKPDILVLPGDLTTNGSKKSHEDLSQKLLQIKSVGTQVYVVPGNHDLNNERAIYFSNNKAFWADYISNDEFVEIYKELGYSEAVSRDSDSLSYLVKVSDNLMIIMIDSTMEFPNSGGYLNANTLKWIEECSEIAKKENTRLIAVMHHNLLDHSNLIADNYTILNNTGALNIFHKCNIDLVLTGHTHLQDIKSDYSSETETTIYDITTGSVSGFPHQFGILTLSEDDGYTYETKKLDVEKFAANNNIEDENLLNFNTYSEKFFVNSCCKNHRNRIFRLSELTNKEKGEIINTVTAMNKAYFSGFRNEALSKYTETEGFKLLRETDPSFIREYIMDMLKDERTDNNNLTIFFAD